MKNYSLIFFFLIILGACSEDQTKNAVQISNAYYDKAFEYKDSNETDSAFFYFNKAKDFFLLQKDSLGAGKCLVNMAIISTDKGDFFGGQEISLQAISFFDQKNEDQYVYIKSNFNNLGIATYRLSNYERAISFYDLAIKFSKDSLSTLVYLNNKASVYQELRKYQQALNIYNQILDASTKNNNEYARILNNKSYTMWLQNPNYNAGPFLLKALKIREKENDLFGQNSSYSTLSDYYAKTKPDSSFTFAKKMYNVAKKTNILEDQVQALQKLVKLSPINETKNYFEIYNKLDDSLEKSRNLAKNQFALIRYESEKNKSDNLILLKDNTEKKYQITKQKVFILFILILIVSGSMIVRIWYKKRKQKLELEAQNTIRQHQLKTSKKVHDVVANKIYSVISEIENRRELDKENLLDKLDHIYHTSRDISYEISDNQQGKKFSQQLLAMFNTYVADSTIVKIIGNHDEVWVDVSNQNKGEIFIVLQELMTNMKKHSKATEVNIKFHKKDNSISILYHDNGIGLPKNVVYNNGLTNTETRIKNISGTLTFETTDKLGLEILISFPVH